MPSHSGMCPFTVSPSWLRSSSSEAAGPIFQKLPEFLANTKYNEPLDNTAGPFQFGHNTKLRSVVWRKERPYIQKAFNNHMAGYHQGRPSWMDPGFYPVRDRIEQGMTQNVNEVAIVDVGGGMGHDLAELRKKQPTIPGRFILQDLPQVIEQISQPLEGIEAIAHDFYTEQPIKGELYGRTIPTTPLNAYMDF